LGQRSQVSQIPHENYAGGLMFQGAAVSQERIMVDDHDVIGAQAAQDNDLLRWCGFEEGVGGECGVDQPFERNVDGQ
jgi:hypothetical protein